jgi:hypothetical protein
MSVTTNRSMAAIASAWLNSSPWIRDAPHFVHDEPAGRPQISADAILPRRHKPVLQAKCAPSASLKVYAAVAPTYRAALARWPAAQHYAAAGRASRA